MLYACSYALDCVEHEFVGVTTNHAKRVAFLSIMLAEHMGYSDEELVDLAGCAVLHDNALAEYLFEEYNAGNDILSNKEMISTGTHCIIGEKNINNIPFVSDTRGAVLYHHENADGSGPFHKKAYETPLMAQIIHFADTLDSKWDMSSISEDKYRDIKQYILENEDVLFSNKCVEVFVSGISYETMVIMTSQRLDKLLHEKLKYTMLEYTDKQIKGIANVFAQIIDYKSKNTSRHSLGIAAKAERMSKYYGFDNETVIKMYLAGALHDLGKIIIDRDILEKPDKLTDEEYKNIQNHAFYTYYILERIRGLEDVTEWASFHHEKLNGCGYPFGKKADELSFNSRLMACLDIYQALTEERAYKTGMSHKKSIDILRNMVDKGELDGKIVEDIDKIFAMELASSDSI